MASILQFDSWADTTGNKFGTVLQTVHATTGFANQTINSSTPVAITGLSVTITPRFSNSVILLFGLIQASWTYVCGTHIYCNGVDINSYHLGNLQTGGKNSIWTYYNATVGTNVDSSYPMFLQATHTPESTSALTYAVYANSGWDGGTNNLYINNRTSTSNDMLGSSYFCAMEIAQ